MAFRVIIFYIYVINTRKFSELKFLFSLELKLTTHLYKWHRLIQIELCTESSHKLFVHIQL